MPEHAPVTIIPDIHGDDHALRRSLKHAGVLTNMKDPLEIKSHRNVTLSGDLLDRGDENLKVLQTITELQSKVRTDINLGNHDVLALDAVARPKSYWPVTEWTYNGGLNVLREIAKQKDLYLDTPNEDYPWKIPLSTPLAQILKLQVRWFDFIDESPDLTNIDLKAAVMSARHTLREQYGTVFENMKIAHSPFPGVLAVHAGVSDGLMWRGWESANDRYKTYYEQEKYDALNHLKPLGKSLWIRSDGMQQGEEFLSEKSANALKKKGISLIVHGHNKRDSAIQEVEHHHGITVINGDVGMSGGYRPDEEGWGYVNIEENGRVFVASDREKKREVFRVPKVS